MDSKENQASQAVTHRVTQTRLPVLITLGFCGRQEGTANEVNEQHIVMQPKSMRRGTKMPLKLLNWLVSLRSVSRLQTHDT